MQMRKPVKLMQKTCPERYGKNPSDRICISSYPFMKTLIMLKNTSSD
jgi:hypothetical protein